MRLLTDHHNTLVTQRTATINRLRWHLHDLDPRLETGLRTLTSRSGQTELGRRLHALPDSAPDSASHSVRRELALELLDDITTLTDRIRTRVHQLEALIRPLASHLLDIVGVGVLTAATIIGETGGIGRFATSAAFALHNGTAPIPVWTSNKPQFGLNRGGNRQLNAALHRIAITQLRHHEPAQQFIANYQERRPHTTHKAALRALKRHLSNTVYHAAITDLTSTNNTTSEAAQNKP